MTTQPEQTGERVERVCRAALDEIRMWRHKQPHTDAPLFAELDAILDRAAVGRIEAHLGNPEPTSLPEAVAAHHTLIEQRHRIITDAHHAWDLAEAHAIRNIARFMPAAGRKGGDA
ncbi:hypothetical protein [Streptomyces indicus]|uniref:Uncharacterized protein n=1 Tax=Streptomyces indicus TaxID=417292 RepID=A0A1G9J8E9_9ACTN|nr:hypothetical protein [Streptomyces indicus]SDL33552.1 hypothetical protein SAMN05421806_12835 [Streptomyces indicus]